MNYSTASAGHHYYYFDIPKNKTRFIVLDNMTSTWIDDTQKTWLTNLINRDDDYSIVVICHAIWSAANSSVTPIGSNLTRIEEAIGDNSDKVMCVLSGHMHMDYSGYTNGGVPIIATDTDGYARLATINPNTATLGTVTEHCFDIITINYETRTIKCVRVGRGSNRTLTRLQ